MVGRTSSRRLTEGEQSTTTAPRETAAATAAEPATGLRKIVAIRQMLRRWQSAGTTAARASSNNASRTPSGAPCGSDHQHQISRGKKPAPEGNRAYRRLLESAGEEPVTPGAPAGVPRGCLAVYVVGGADSAEPERRRFVVPTACLGTPAFRQLLEKAEEEFGFCYAGGALTIPCGCDAEAFEHVLVVMDRHRKGLVDGDGNPTEAAGENGESSGNRE